MRRLSGRQWCGVAVIVLLVLYFHAVMPPYEFWPIMVIVFLVVGLGLLLASALGLGRRRS